MMPTNGLYLTGEDNLRLTTFGALAGVTLAVEGRLEHPDGTVTPLAERHVPNSDYTAKTNVYPVAEGFLTNVQVRATSAGVIRGHVFAVLEVIRGREGGVQPLGTLLQDYVTTNQRLAWPGSPVRSSLEGRGRIRSITGSDPPAGNNLLEMVPAGARWRFISLRANFVASVVVASRGLTLRFDDGANVYAAFMFPTLVTASSAQNVTWAASGVASAAAAADFTMPIGMNIELPAGHRIQTAVASLDAGDNWGAPQYLVEEFIEG